jgi:nicotinamidase-related amidase
MKNTAPFRDQGIFNRRRRSKMAKAVVIVDMLNDFVQENGKLPVKNSRTLVENIARIKAEAEKNGVMVLYANDAHDENDKEFENWPPHAVEGTDGAKAIDELRPNSGNLIVEKKDLGTFTNPEADELLQQHGIDELIVTGVATEYCVRGVCVSDLDKYGNHVKAATDRGYKVNVVVDAITGVDEIVLQDGTSVPFTKGAVNRALIEMGNAGVKPIYTEEVLEALAS